MSIEPNSSLSDLDHLIGMGKQQRRGKPVKEESPGNNPNPDEREALESHYDGFEERGPSYQEEQEDEEYRLRMIARHQAAKEKEGE